MESDAHLEDADLHFSKEKKEGIVEKVTWADVVAGSRATSNEEL
jgi:hypothetical protein